MFFHVWSWRNVEVGHLCCHRKQLYDWRVKINGLTLSLNASVHPRRFLQDFDKKKNHCSRLLCVSIEQTSFITKPPQVCLAVGFFNGGVSRLLVMSDTAVWPTHTLYFNYQESSRIHPQSFILNVLWCCQWSLCAMSSVSLFYSFSISFFFMLLLDCQTLLFAINATES